MISGGSSGPRDPAAARGLRSIYRRLLRLLPSRVRDEYAEEMWETARRLEEEFREGHGRGALRRFWMRENLGLVRTLLLAYRDRGRDRVGRGMSLRGAAVAAARDLRQAMRSCLRRPGYLAIAVVTVGLGIGANAALFSVVDGVLFDTLPGLEADRLVQIWEIPHGPGDRWEIAPADFQDYRTRTRALEALGGYGFTMEFTYMADDEPRVLRALPVSSNFFDVVRADPLYGRTFLAEEEKDPEGIGVVVLSHAFWRSELGGDPAVIGRTLRLDDDEAVVVGVMPPRFHVQTRPVDMWFPVWAATDESWSRTFHYWYGIGRLTPDLTPEDAERDLLAIAHQLEVEHPETNRGHLIELVPLREAVVGDVRTSLFVLLGVVGFVLLIACSNVANMSLVEVTRRRRELAVRAALGASHSELLRLTLAEGLIVAALGGAVGLGLAYLGLDLLVGLSPLALPGVAVIELDATVLGFTATATVITALFISLAPALSLSRTDFIGTLKEGGRGATVGREQRRAQRAFLTLQLAVAAALLIGAGLMLRSFQKLQAVEPGASLDNVLTARVRLPDWRYEDEAARLEFWNRLVERVEAIPGVTGASLTSVLPVRGGGYGSALFTDAPNQPDVASRPAMRVRIVQPGYFSLMRIPFLMGRDHSRDDRSGPPVAVINESMASRFWPDGAVGHRFKLGNDVEEGPWIEVIGVIQNVKEQGLQREALPAVYLSNLQNPRQALRLVARTELDPAQIVPAVRGSLRDLDAMLPLQEVQTMSAVAGAAVERERSTALLLGIFAALATLLAALGVYGVISYSVAQRNHEIAVRMALGADAARVLGSVIGEVLLTATPAIGLGLLVAAGGSRVLSGMLYQVSALDPVTFTSIPFLLTAVALVAAFVPARRAATTDPARTLQEE